MDIEDEQQLSDIANYVVNVRNNSTFVPTDMSLPQQSYQYEQHNNVHRIAYLVVDTNFILSHLNLLNELEILSQNKYPGVYQIVIPKQVIHELDGLKNSSGSDLDMINSQHAISNLARSAIEWCYSHIHDSIPTVTGQRLYERIDRDAVKDNAILDCCLYFQNVENGGDNMVVLMSNDKNLCVKSLVNNVLTISYRPEMTAKLIASNIILEMQNRNNINGMNDMNDANGINSMHNIKDQDIMSYNNNSNVNYEQHYMDDENMDINVDNENSNILQNSAIKADAKSTLSLYDISKDIFSQITQLVLEAVEYAVSHVFEDDVEMSGYNSKDIKTLRDAARCILKMGLSTFSEFFNRRGYNPIQILKDKSQLQMYTNLPTDITDLKDFIEFWTQFLDGIYKDRDVKQKNALKQISGHWQSLIREVTVV